MKKKKNPNGTFAGYWRWWLIGLLALGTQAVQAQGQKDEDDTIIIKEEVKEQKEVSAPTPIGLEAVREVIDSGRYLVGPGDEFLVFISGGANGGEHLTTEVLAQGGLLIPGMGLVKVGGLRLKEAIERIHQEFDKRVRHRQLTVELSQVRRFPVTIVGRVLEPGVYQASAVERVGEILRRHEFLSGAYSRRNIRIYKTSTRPERDAVASAESVQQDSSKNLAQPEFQQIDLMLYKATGLSRYNPFVEDGDIIDVLPEEGEIIASGAVNRTGIYEFVPGDRLRDLGPTFWGWGSRRTATEKISSSSATPMACAG